MHVGVSTSTLRIGRRAMYLVGRKKKTLYFQRPLRINENKIGTDSQSLDKRSRSTHLNTVMNQNATRENTISASFWSLNDNADNCWQSTSLCKWKRCERGYRHQQQPVSGKKAVIWLADEIRKNWLLATKKLQLQSLVSDHQ